MENDEKQLIETVDEEGNVINFELFDIIEVDDSNINEERNRILKNIGNRDYVINKN